MTPEELAREIVNRVNEATWYDDGLWAIINAIAGAKVTYEDDGSIIIRDKYMQGLIGYISFNELLGVNIPSKGFKTYIKKTKTCLKKLVKEELSKEPVDLKDAMKKVLLYEPLNIKFNGKYEKAYNVYCIISETLGDWQDAAMEVAKELNY